MVTANPCTLEKCGPGASDALQEAQALGRRDTVARPCVPNRPSALRNRPVHVRCHSKPSSIKVGPLR